MVERTFGKHPRKDDSEEGIVPAVLLREWKNRALNLLSLVSGVFGIPPPRTFDKGERRSDLLVGTVSLNHKVEVVRVPELIRPCDFLSGTCWPVLLLVVQVKTLCRAERFKLR